MIYKEFFGKPIKYFDTSLIASILSIVTAPTLWYISQGNFFWVFTSVIIWWIGSFTIFHPSIRFLFPFLLTKMGTFALTFILAIGTILLNSTIITMLMPIRDIEMILNTTLFSTSISTIALLVWLYVIIAGTTVANMHLNINYILYKQKKFLRQIFTISEYYIETLFLFILPVSLLFWTDITYSFRVLLGLISIAIGITLFISKISTEKLQQKILVSAISIASILVINGAIINLLSMNSTTINNTIETKNISNQAFQLSKNEQNNNIIVYQIVASIPQIGLNLGHRIATIPNRKITVESSKSQYTIHDQYNNKVLLTLEK